MLAIGRALMSAPKLIMVDEPSIGLAPIVVNDIFDILARLNREGYTILLSEQNANKALKCAHRGLRAGDGERDPQRDRRAAAERSRRPGSVPGSVGMQVFIAQVINGLSLGSIYVLLVTGFNLLLLVAMIIHFSYPQVVVFSMYITWVVLQATGNNLVLGVLAGVASSIVLNLISAPLFQKVMAEARRGGHQQHHGPLHGHRDDHHRRAVPLASTRALPIAFPDSLAGDAR